MTRRNVPSRKVEDLARECRILLVWLRGDGASAGADAFAAAHQAYRALIDAVSMLPHGPKYLRELRALPKVRRPARQPDTLRAADAFTLDELATMTSAVLTPTGWVVPVALVAHVDRERARIGATSTDKAALTEILTRRSQIRGESVNRALSRDLRALQKRLSVERSRWAAIETADKSSVTERSEKVPPSDT